MASARAESPAVDETAVLRSRPRLSWTDATGSHVVPLTCASTIGSAPWCELVLTDRAVSRLHAELAPRDDGLWVRDLGSRNGTFIAGVKVNDARVPEGATIRFGTTDVLVSYEAPAPVLGLWPDTSFHGLYGASVAMREVFARVAHLAHDDEAVLFLGEAGTGKEALARAMHEASIRSGAPFVVLDCAAPESEAPSFLEEALHAAHGGTLLLDEPAELSLTSQRDLLAPLDARVFRVMSASRRDLRPLVNQGTVREALYFRIAGGATIVVPPVRDRLGDVPGLLERLLGDRAALATPAVLADVVRAPWAANVREVERYAERLRASGDPSSDFPAPLETAETAADVPPWDADFAEHDFTTQQMPVLEAREAASVVRSSDGAVAPPAFAADIEPWFETGFKAFRERWNELGEREYLRRLMKRTKRSSTSASKEAGLERTYLYRLLRKHGV